MNTANWIPDLFMRRVMEKGQWTLFSPSNVPDLHDKFGADFEKAYVAYEEQAARGEIKPSRTLEAADLWRKMLTMLLKPVTLGSLSKMLVTFGHHNSTLAWFTPRICALRLRSIPQTPRQPSAISDLSIYCSI